MVQYPVGQKNINGESSPAGVASLLTPEENPPNAEEPAVGAAAGVVVVAGSGFFPNKPPPKRLPLAGAVPPEGADAPSAGFACEPNSLPVGAVVDATCRKKMSRWVNPNEQKTFRTGCSRGCVSWLVEDCRKDW
jgi:hypothetical protein